MMTGSELSRVNRALLAGAPIDAQDEALARRLGWVKRDEDAGGGTGWFCPVVDAYRQRRDALREMFYFDRGFDRSRFATKADFIAEYFAEHGVSLGLREATKVMRAEGFETRMRVRVRASETTRVWLWVRGEGVSDAEVEYEAHLRRGGELTLETLGSVLDAEEWESFNSVEIWGKWGGQIPHGRVLTFMLDHLGYKIGEDGKWRRETPF